jgi:RHS repeat-associated protein
MVPRRTRGIRPAPRWPGSAPPGGGSGVLALTDSHGDVLGQFAATSTVMAGSQAYDPWGNVTATTGSLSGLLGFQSAWTDPGTGKDLMGARWHAPSAGDFTSADTMQVPAVPDPAAGTWQVQPADGKSSPRAPTRMR